jgi:hypothetical protein
MTIGGARGPGARGFTLVFGATVGATAILFGARVSKSDPACVEVEGCIASPGLGSRGFSPPSSVRSHLCTERTCRLRSSMRRKRIQLRRGEWNERGSYGRRDGDKQEVEDTIMSIRPTSIRGISCFSLQCAHDERTGGDLICTVYTVRDGQSI